jgi:DeoR family suf operon transcriptional repressor
VARQAILMALKRQGPARAEELAAALGITSSAVRQQLTGLVGEGLVAYEQVRGGPGRPKHVYRLTPAAETQFPKTYGELATEMLEYVADADPALVQHLFERRRERRIEGAKQRLSGLPFDDRVAELARILDDDGYLAAVEPMNDGRWRIVEHNCAILEVAQRYDHACSSEIEFIRAVLPEADVERVKHMLAGAHVCAYEVTPKPKVAARTRGARAPRRPTAPR